MSAIDDLNTDLTAARTAISSGDYATALTKIEMAEVSLARMPNSWHGGNKIEFRDAIEALRKHISSKQSAAVGIQRSKVEYINTTG